ncbi:MAG: phosphoribosylanthranilate isomerase [Phycisphaerales bacterium]
MTGARVRIKICGVRTAEIVQVAAEAGADAVGFVLAPGSPRRIDAETAVDLAATLPPWVAPVAVFADAEVDEMLGAWPHDWIQLHGREADVHPALARRSVVKAVPITVGDEELLRWDAHPRVRALLVDAPRAGAGETFDLAPLVRVRARLGKPLIVAGGLTPRNVARIIREVHPWAVDVSSGVESSRGTKDASLIREFCDAVRA